jgi:multicomponent Na+:H+ antiporter subunit G
MFAQLVPWLADGLVLLGVATITIAVYGVIRMPDLYTKLHAASKAAFLGVVSLCLASVVTGNSDIIARVVLIAALLLLTTPVSSHVIGRGAYLERAPMETPGAVDESARGLRAGEDQARPPAAI